MRLRQLANRSRGVGLPSREEIECFGADGEEAVCRLLRKDFDCVIRNVIVPHKKKLLEKDFLVIYKGAPFVIEVKNWKGTVRRDGDNFTQDKENGVHKVLKSPIGTTNQFISCMKDYYGISRPIYGIVAFCEPDCTLDLPESIDGVALLKADKLAAFVKACVKKEEKGLEALAPDRILRCTRFYSTTEEFCKGLMVEDFLEVTDQNGREVMLDATKLRYITVERQLLRMRDKLYVTFQNGASAVFYNRDLTVTVACLDGTYRKISLNRIRYIVF